MISYKDPSRENWFLVSWTLSNKCNYRCTYCPDNVHNGTTGHPRWPTVERFIKNFSMPGKEICYRISGGEPTYWKHFIDMGRVIKEQGHTFSFLTNGSQTVDYFKTINQFTDGMILSYHREYANLPHLIDVINSMSCPVAVNLMLLPDKFDELVDVAKTLHDNTYCAVWPKLILDKTNSEFITNKVYNYSDDQKELIDNWPYFRKLDDAKLHRGELLLDGVEISANDLILKDLNHHKGWLCYGGIDMINIDMWGNIYRSDCQNGGPLGNIERFGLPTIPIICERNTCSCLSDIYLRKIRS